MQEAESLPWWGKPAAVENDKVQAKTPSLSLAGKTGYWWSLPLSMFTYININANIHPL